MLIVAGIIHNYSFMCRKMKPEELKVFYPVKPVGKLIFDGSWILLAAAGLFLTLDLSAVLTAVAALIYFLLLPFILQPPLAKLLGFHSLADYVEYIDQNKKNGS